MDLFDYMREQNMEKESPLAARLRPTTLDEVVGQEHIIGKDKLFYSFLWTAGNRKDHAGKSDCQYHQC